MARRLFSRPSSTPQDQLERCQKALNNFLEEKRQGFARFYFMGDEDLLEVLGQASKPEVIQSRETRGRRCGLESSVAR